MKRREFLQKTAAAGVAGAVFTIVPRSVLGKGFIAPSDKLIVAGIGVGGKGIEDLRGVAMNPKTTVGFLCDVDNRQAVEARKTYSKAKYYKDFREMLDKEPSIDAVTVTTPDHTHYSAAMAAMERKKHVYLQKPLTWSIYESRKLAEAASKFKVVTQMGNQFASADPVRKAKEMVDAGLIGDVTQVYAWTNRPVWPQGVPKPTGNFKVPKELDWNLWLGPAPKIDFNPAYLPFNWRGWWSFGTGALGDMACHILDASFRILPIDFANEVECSTTTEWSGFFEEAHYNDSCPASSIIHFNFPRKDGKGNIKLTWMDGGLLPQRPDELLPDERLGDYDGGYLFIGTKGKLMGNYNMDPVLLPTRRMKEETLPTPSIPRIQGGPWGHYTTWVDACTEGYESNKTTLSSPFSYAAPFTEAILLGNLALRSYAIREGEGYPGRKKLLWNAAEMKITNFEPANQFVRRAYQNGWKDTY